MIYFYWGADGYRSKQTVDALKEKFKTTYDPGGHNIEVLDEHDFSLETFFTAAKAMGFLSPKKCVVIKNIFSLKTLAAVTPPLIEYLDSLRNTTDENYLVFWHEGAPRKNAKLFTYLTGRCDKRCQAEFEQLTGERLRAWVMQRAQQMGHTLSVELAHFVIELVGADTWRLNNEIKKICHAAADTTITQELIERTASAAAGETIFPLLDAISMRNRARAFELLERTLAGEFERQFVIAMLGRQMRLLIETKRITRETRNTYAVAQTLKVPPFVATKLAQQSQRFEIDELVRMHEAVVALDLASKRTPERVGAMMAVLFAKL